MIRGLRETTDLLVLLESRGRMGRLDPRDRRDLRVLWGRLAKLGVLVPQDLPGLLEILERQGIRVPPVLRAQVAYLEKRDLLGPPAPPGKLAKRARPGQRALGVKLARRVARDRKAKQDR